MLPSLIAFTGNLVGDIKVGSVIQGTGGLRTTRVVAKGKGRFWLLLSTDGLYAVFAGAKNSLRKA